YFPSSISVSLSTYHRSLYLNIPLLSVTSYMPGQAFSESFKQRVVPVQLLVRFVRDHLNKPSVRGASQLFPGSLLEWVSLGSVYRRLFGYPSCLSLSWSSF